MVLFSYTSSTTTAITTTTTPNTYTATTMTTSPTIITLTAPPLLELRRTCGTGTSWRIAPRKALVCHPHRPRHNRVAGESSRSVGPRGFVYTSQLVEVARVFAYFFPHLFLSLSFLWFRSRFSCVLVTSFAFVCLFVCWDYQFFFDIVNLLINLAIILLLVFLFI